MAKHWPGVVWGLRLDHSDGYVKTTPENTLKVYVRALDAWQVDGDLVAAEMDRPTARLLAKRILQALEATK